jgi:hypothetical protein
MFGQRVACWEPLAVMALRRRIVRAGINKKSECAMSAFDQSGHSAGSAPD